MTMTGNTSFIRAPNTESAHFQVQVWDNITTQYLFDALLLFVRRHCGCFIRIRYFGGRLRRRAFWSPCDIQINHRGLELSAAGGLWVGCADTRGDYISSRSIWIVFTFSLAEKIVCKFHFDIIFVSHKLLLYILRNQIQANRFFSNVLNFQIQTSKTIMVWITVHGQSWLSKDVSFLLICVN